METVTHLQCVSSSDEGGKGSRRRRRNVMICKSNRGQESSFRLGSLISHYQHNNQPFIMNQRTVLLGLLILQIHSVICLTSKSQYQQSQNYNNILPDNIVDFNGKGKLKYVWGDALADPKAMGPDGNHYPWELASKFASKQRNPRTLFAEEFGGADIGLINPETTRQILLKSFEAQEFGRGMNSFFGTLSHSHHHHHAHAAAESDSVDSRANRQPRSFNREGHAYAIRGRGTKRVSSATSTVPSTDNQQQDPTTSDNNNPYKNYQYREGDTDTTSTSSPPIASTANPGGGHTGGPPSDGGCVPSRLCPSTYNTTAPLYGISLTSGQPVTIVQKFPDLLQQVVFQVCKTSECDVIHGECVQTYLPYLFLVIPLGPVTLTGQDYVLVESGCVCRPKYASKQDEPPPLPFIQVYNTTKERRTQQG